MKRINLLMLAIILASLVMAACNGGGDPTPPPSTNCNNPGGCDIFSSPETLEAMRKVCEATGGQHVWRGDRWVCDAK